MAKLVFPDCDKCYNDGIETAQAFLRKYAISYAQAGDTKAFEVLEATASAIENLKKG